MGGYFYAYGRRPDQPGGSRYNVRVFRSGSRLFNKKSEIRSRSKESTSDGSDGSVRIRNADDQLHNSGYWFIGTFMRRHVAHRTTWTLRIIFDDDWSPIDTMFDVRGRRTTRPWGKCMEHGILRMFPRIFPIMETDDTKERNARTHHRGICVGKYDIPAVWRI